MAEGLSWVDPLGVVTDLTCGGYPLDGVSGRFSPPISYSDSPVPGQPGAVLTVIRHDVREVDVPYILTATTEAALWTAIRSLARLLDPTRGTGYLLSTGPDGTVRRLNCRCVGGPSMTETLGETKMMVQSKLVSFMLVFRAEDPYWYDNANVTQTFTVAASASFFPIFPLVLSAGGSYATAAINNDGDVEAWPVWTVTGPFDAFRIENTDTGEFVEVNYSAAAGEIITVDSRDGVKTIVSSIAGNLYIYREDGSTLWPLATGTNNIAVSIVGGTSSSSVALAYARRWLSV